MRKDAKDENVISQNISPSLGQMDCDDINGPSLYENVMVLGKHSSDNSNISRNGCSLTSSKNKDINITIPTDNLHASENSISEIKVCITSSKNTSPLYKMVMIQNQLESFFWAPKNH